MSRQTVIMMTVAVLFAFITGYLVHDIVYGMLLALGAGVWSVVYRRMRGQS